MMNNSLKNNLYFRNNMNFMNMNQNINYHQPSINRMGFNPINLNYIPYQIYQNNFNNYQKQFYMKNPVFFLNNSNKFDLNYSNNYQNPLFSKNNWNSKNNEFIKLKKEETVFNDKEIKKQNKKNSMDSDDSDKISNTSTEEENNEKIEKNEKKEENSDLNVTKNKNKDDGYEISETKKRGRRFSNISNVSNFSKCSVSTTDTFTSPINERNVLMKGLEKKKENELEKYEDENKVEKYEGNPDFENTVILNVNVKLSKDRTAVFKLKRFDDLFMTIKLFCEINSVDEKFIKPLIIKSLSTLNTIYQVMNCKLENNQINTLKQIQNETNNCK